MRVSEIDGEPLKQQATATLTYDVLVDLPFPARIETVRTQGRVTYADPEALDGMAAVRTDDPDTFVLGDATDTPIDRAADMALVKTASTATPGVGSAVVFTVAVTNQGPAAPATVTVREVLPAGLVYTGHTASVGSFDPATGQWSAVSVGLGAPATLVLTARVETPEQVENVAEVVASQVPDPDSEPGNGVAGEDDRSSVQVEAEAVPTSVEEGEAVPVRYALGVNYPNPFQGETVIPFGVPAGSAVRLAVYDVLGREVEVLVDGVVAAGRYAVVFRAGGLPTGLYVVRMEAGAVVKTRRITLVK